MVKTKGRRKSKNIEDRRKDDPRTARMLLEWMAFVNAAPEAANEMRLAELRERMKERRKRRRDRTLAEGE